MDGRIESLIASTGSLADDVESRLSTPSKTDKQEERRRRSSRESKVGNGKGLGLNSFSMGTNGEGKAH